MGGIKIMAINTENRTEQSLRVTVIGTIPIYTNALLLLQK